jgi:hypothetical protein
MTWIKHASSRNLPKTGYFGEKGCLVNPKDDGAQDICRQVGIV